MLNGSSHKYGVGGRVLAFPGGRTRVGAAGPLLGIPGPIRAMPPNPVRDLVPPTGTTVPPTRDMSTDHLKCQKHGGVTMATGACNCTPSPSSTSAQPQSPQPAQPSSPAQPQLPGPSFGPPSQQQPSQPKPPQNYLPVQPQQPGQAQPAQPSQPGTVAQPQPQQPQPAHFVPQPPQPAHFVPQPGLPQSVPSQPGLSHAVPSTPGQLQPSQPSNPPGLLTNHATTPSTFNPGVPAGARFTPTPQPQRPGYGLGDGLIAEPRLGAAGAWQSTKGALWSNRSTVGKVAIWGGTGLALAIGIGLIAASGGHDSAHEGPPRDPETGRFI